MNDFILTSEILLILSPLFFLQISLAAYCWIKIIKEGVMNLNRWAWLLICLFLGVVGPMLFLLIGRRREFK